MIEFANVNDNDEIIRLWKICFGDSNEYISCFLNKRMNTENCLVHRENSNILSMLFLLEGKLKISSELYNSFYIYAACTDPEYRGRGLMAGLIGRTAEIAVENDKDYICLVPANSGLFEYYARFGFETVFKKKVISFNRRQLYMLSAESAEIYNPDIKEITDLRNMVFSSGDCYLWDEKAVAYSIFENESIGGKMICVRNEGKLAGYALFFETDERVIVKELCVTNRSFGSLIKLLVSSSKSEYFTLNLPVNFPLTSDNFNIKDNGMAKPISAKGGESLQAIYNAYIGLTLE
jgi:predicted acetyltransferase